MKNQSNLRGHGMSTKKLTAAQMTMVERIAEYQTDNGCGPDASTLNSRTLDALIRKGVVRAVTMSAGTLPAWLDRNAWTRVEVV